MAGIFNCLDLEKEGPASGEVLEGVRGREGGAQWVRCLRSELLPGRTEPLGPV